MNKIDEFKIRNYFKVKSKDQFLVGKEAIVEYIRQLFSVLKTELWFDYEYGIEVSNINENNINLWLQDNLEQVPFIQEIRKINVNKLEKNFEVYLDIVLNDNESINEEIKLKI